MKKILAGLSFFLATSQVVLAQTVCKVNGEVVPCPELPGWLGIVFAAIPLLALFFFVFWIWMLIDAIKNQKDNKLMWVLLIIFLNALGAIIYYFSQKRTRAKV